MTIQAQNNNLNYLIDPTSTNINRLFVLSFERNIVGDSRGSFSHCYVPNVEIKDFNALIDGKNFFDLPVKNEEKLYQKIIHMSNNNDYTTGNLLNIAYFKENHRLIGIDLSKQTKLKDPQQISFIGKLLNRHGATMFFIIKKWEETTFNFPQNSVKIDSKGNYSHKNPIKFLTSLLESNLRDYAYILVTENITVTRTIAAAAAADGDSQRKQPPNAAIQVIFKNFAPFKDCRTEINDTFVDYAEFINIVKPVYNSIEYSGNYFDTSGSFWDFKRDDIINNANVTNDDNAPSFKYKANLIGNTETNRTKKGVKIVIPLKNFSNFSRSLEMPLTNCKVELLLNWIENCVLTSAAIGANANGTGADSATFKITDARLYVPIFTLSAEGNAKLSKLLAKYLKDQFNGIDIK